MPANRPLRILYLINDLAVGGAQRVLVSQACGLDPTRYAAEVASLEIIPGSLGDELAPRGIPVHALRTPAEPVAAAWPRLVRLLRSGRYAALHSHLAAAEVAGSLAACCADVRAVVATLHNLRDWEESRNHPLRWMERRTLALADRVIAVSDAVRDAVTRCCPRLARRTVVVRNGVDLERVRGTAERRAPARARYGFGGNEFVVGAIARFDRSKGLDVLLEAVALAAPRIPTLRLLLAGDGAERERLESLARTLRIAGITTFAGTQREIRDPLAAFDIFAAPSRTEGLGIAILEALAAGVPALGARVGGIPEVIEDEICGELVDGLEPRRWADRIAALAVDRSRLARLAAAAPAQAARFSMAASVGALQTIYDAALAASDAGDRDALEEAA
jgi:glycosyltransferase involved in cell wall biosynthesis